MVLLFKAAHKRKQTVALCKFKKHRIDSHARVTAFTSSNMVSFTSVLDSTVTHYALVTAGVSHGRDNLQSILLVFEPGLETNLVQMVRSFQYHSNGGKTQRAGTVAFKPEKENNRERHVNGDFHVTDKSASPGLQASGRPCVLTAPLQQNERSLEV
eukprot:5792063-Amphidinium_carterae.1